jgi:hypothetical protein
VPPFFTSDHFNFLAIPLATMEREHIPEGIPETKRELKEKKEKRIGEKAAAEGSPGTGGEGGPPV